MDQFRDTEFQRQHRGIWPKLLDRVHDEVECGHTAEFRLVEEDQEPFNWICVGSSPEEATHNLNEALDEYDRVAATDWDEAGRELDQEESDKVITMLSKELLGRIGQEEFSQLVNVYRDFFVEYA